MRENSNLRKIFSHSVVWLILLSINIFFFANLLGHSSDMYLLIISLNIVSWLMYLTIFYVNYLVLIPLFMHRGRMKIYVLLSILLVAAGFTGIRVVNESEYYRKRANEMPRVRTREEVLKGIMESKYFEELGEEVSKLDMSQPMKDSVMTTIAALFADRHNRPNIDKRQVPKGNNSRNHLTGQDYRLITNLYMILLLYLSSLVLGSIEKSKQRRRDMDKLQKEKISNELLFLKQQINPHFLFNALNSIYSLVLPHSDSASDSLLKLASILRYMLYETDKEMVSLEKELEIAEDYIALQKLKFNDTTKVTFNVVGQVIGHNIEPLIIVPFLENAFKYGADNITDSFIDINVTMQESYFNLDISNKVVVHRDNGESSGIGIANVRRRLDLIYQNNYTLDINEQEGVFSVKLRLKLQ